MFSLMKKIVSVLLSALMCAAVLVSAPTVFADSENIVMEINDEALPKGNDTLPEAGEDA